MHQALQGATFHAEHIIPTSRGGDSHLDNLALACPACNLRKANRVSFKFEGSDKETELFHPRRQQWSEHFAWRGYEILGLTSVGQATIAALELNQERRRTIRRAEASFGLYPPPGE